MFSGDIFMEPRKTEAALFNIKISHILKTSLYEECDHTIKFTIMPNDLLRLFLIIESATVFTFVSAYGDTTSMRAIKNLYIYIYI